MNAILTLTLLLTLTGCAGSNLGRGSIYVMPQGTVAGRQADFDACMPPGRLMTYWLLGLPGSVTASVLEVDPDDCMAARGWHKSQRGMVPPDAMEALTPLPVNR